MLVYIMKLEKLVRDKIPTIIETRGDVAKTRHLSDDEEFLDALKVKLQEEVSEFLADDSLDELADILEVIHGILLAKGVNFPELERIRASKHAERGGFEGRVFLESTNGG